MGVLEAGVQILTQAFDRTDFRQVVVDQVAAELPVTTIVERVDDRIRALEQLPPRERMVFELKHYQDLKLCTIANMLHTTEGTIKNTLFRATHKLRCSLAEMRAGA